MNGLGHSQWIIGMLRQSTGIGCRSPKGGGTILQVFLQCGHKRRCFGVTIRVHQDIVGRQFASCGAAGRHCISQSCPIRSTVLSWIDGDAILIQWSDILTIVGGHAEIRGARHERHDKRRSGAGHCHEPDNMGRWWRCCEKGRFSFLFQSMIRSMVVVVVACLEHENQSQQGGYRHNESPNKLFVLLELFCEWNTVRVTSHDGICILVSSGECSGEMIQRKRKGEHRRHLWELRKRNFVFFY